MKTRKIVRNAKIKNAQRFAAFIMLHCEKNNISIEKLAKEAGLGGGTLHNYLSSINTSIRRNTYNKLRSVLGKDMDKYVTPPKGPRKRVKQMEIVKEFDGELVEEIKDYVAATGVNVVRHIDKKFEDLSNYLNDSSNNILEDTKYTRHVEGLFDRMAKAIAYDLEKRDLELYKQVNHMITAAINKYFEPDQSVNSID